MSYTTGTTHYNLPQTVGSDKRDWTDTNEAFSDVDAALWEAHQGATQAALDIASINSEIQTITGKQADDEADIATISGKVSTLETTVGNHTTEIGDVRRDLQDNIESHREDTATSTHAYEIGDYFYYNDVLFKATAQIAIGATIVPNTNCTGVTVMSEMTAGGASPDASQVSYDNTTSGLTADDVQEAVDELAAEKIDTFSGSVADASQNTYTAVTADGIAYDATNDQLLLKVNGADTVIPFKKSGSVGAYASAGDYRGGTTGGADIIYKALDGTFKTLQWDGQADIISHDFALFEGTLIKDGVDKLKCTLKEAGKYALTQPKASGVASILDLPAGATIDLALSGTAVAGTGTYLASSILRIE